MSNDWTSQLATALGRPAGDPAIARLVALLDGLASNHLNVVDAQVALGRDPALAPISALVSFQGAVVGGDVTMGDVAGGHIVKISLTQVGQQVVLYQVALPQVGDVADQPVYETLPPLDLPDLFPPAQRLIGHQEERAHLAALYDQIARARRGKFVFLTGRPGHGRRALAHALAEDARTLGGAVLYVRFWPTQRLDPDERDALLDDDPLIPAEVADLEPALAAAWPQACEIAGRPWLRLVAQASQILGRPLTPRDERLPDTPESLSGILRRLARNSAVLLVIEGIDTAPTLWLDLLRFLAPEIAHDIPALVVATLDAGQPLAELPPEHYTEALHLAATLHDEGRADLHWLGSVDAAAIGTYIGTAQPDIPRRLNELSDGVPAIVESLWEAWAAEEVVAQDQHGIWQIADAGRGWVFGDLRAFAYQLLRARLTPEAPLDLEQAEAVLACAALEGPTFTAQAVARALDLDPAAVLSLLDDYLLAEDDRPGLVAEVGFVPIRGLDLIWCPNMYGFEYPYLWHLWGTYGLPEQRRITLQRRLADALEAVYHSATDMVAAQLIALFEASGQPQRAAPYRARRESAATTAALRWQVAILERLARTEFDHYRLYEARIELSQRLYEAAAYTEGAMQATAALELARAFADEQREAMACSWVGLHLHELGDYRAARPYVERALAIREQVLGAHHPHTATSLSDLGYLLKDQGELAAARPYFERALAICEQVLGPHHPHTATSLSDLGALLHAQGELAAARPYFERALAICEQVLRPHHPHTATSLSGLGYLLKDQGDLAGARPYLVQALAICEQVLGPHHPDTATSLSGLGALLHAQGELAAARPYFERALAIREQVLGPHHPHTATSLSGLGYLLKDQGDLAGARPYFERALAICEQVLGPHHPHTATSLSGLGSLLMEQGDLAGARPYFERALAIREQVLGPHHPHTATSLKSLGGLLLELGEFTAARPLYERAVTIEERVLGVDHLETATSLGNLAGLLYEQGEYAAAHPLYERAVAIKERLLGVDHPDTAVFLGGLAASLYAEGEYTAAHSIAERALQIAVQTLGPQHAMTERLRQNFTAIEQHLQQSTSQEDIRSTSGPAPPPQLQKGA